LLKLGDVLASALKYGSLVLLDTWDKLGNVLNAFIDDLATATLN